MTSSSRPPVDEHALAELLAPLSVARAFPELARQAPVEFAQHVEPAVRVVGVPDTSAIPTPVMNALDALASACREEYGLGVEVEAAGEREAALLAVETIRRYLA